MNIEEINTVSSIGEKQVHYIQLLIFMIQLASTTLSIGIYTSHQRAVHVSYAYDIKPEMSQKRLYIRHVDDFVKFLQEDSEILSVINCSAIKTSKKLCQWRISQMMSVSQSPHTAQQNTLKILGRGCQGYLFHSLVVLRRRIPSPIDSYSKPGFYKHEWRRSNRWSGIV